MKSVLHIGYDTISHSKEGLRKGFLAAGFTEYHFFNWQNCQIDEGILGCQARMIQAAKNLSPDLIFVQIQLPGILDEEMVIELSKCGFTVNYTFDVRAVENTEWLYELAPHFGLTLFACKEDADEARRREIHNVGNIHSSCDPDFYRPLNLPEEEKKKYPEIVFIGNNYERTNLGFEKSKEREEMVNFMKAEFGDRFGVFGMNWGSQSRIINPDEEVRIYNSAKVVVCHNNYLKTAYCSDRQWRSISCGAFTVPQYYEGVEKDFHAIDSWRTLDHLKRTCVYALDRHGHGIVERWKEEDREIFLNRHLWKHRIESIKQMIHEQRTAASDPVRGDSQNQ